MNCYLLHMYLPALLSTLGVETGVAILLGLRRKRQLLAVNLATLVTHPLIHVFILVSFFFRLLPSPLPLTVILGLEVGVFLAEWGLLKYALRLGTMRAGVISLSMNAASYLLGVLW